MTTWLHRRVGAQSRITHPSHDRLPAWARIADLLTIALLLLLLWVLWVGSIDTNIFGVRVVVRSVARLARNLVLLTVLRHALVRRPTLISSLRSQAARAAAWIEARWPAAADALPVAIGTRVAVLFLGYVAVAAFGFPRGELPFRFAFNELYNLPARWDAGWYLGIVVDGYDWQAHPQGQVNIAFFPAYPMLVRAAGLFQLGHDDLVAASWIALLVSVIAFAAALTYLYRLAGPLGLSIEQSRAALLLLSAYPFAVFYGAPYTESLFLLVTVAACFHQTRGEAVRAGAWGLLAGLTRPNGVMLSAVLGLLASHRVWRSFRAWRDEHRPPAAARASGALVVAALMPVVGTLLYSTVSWWHTGQPFAWAEAQRIGWGRSTDALQGLMRELRQVVNDGWLAYAARHPERSLHLLAAVFGLCAIWPVTKRFGAAYGAWVALNLLVPLAFGGLLSIGRLTAVLFPIFLWLAVALTPRARGVLVCGFAILQGLCAALFFTWRPLY